MPIKRWTKSHRAKYQATMAARRKNGNGHGPNGHGNGNGHSNGNGGTTVRSVDIADAIHAQRMMALPIEGGVAHYRLTSIELS